MTLSTLAVFLFTLACGAALVVAPFAVPGLFGDIEAASHSICAGIACVLLGALLSDLAAHNPT